MSPEDEQRLLQDRAYAIRQEMAELEAERKQLEARLAYLAGWTDAAKTLA